MNPDDFGRAWRAESSQTRLDVDADLLLDEVRRDERELVAKLIRRDVIEVGAALLMVPVWLYLGVKLSLPWTWYLMVPALAWVAVTMLRDLTRQIRRRRVESGEPLREWVEKSLAEVRRQIRLLRSVLWWSLLPLGLPGAVFLGQMAWDWRSLGWAMVAVPGVVFAGGAIVFWGVYRMNRDAIRTDLKPRQKELEALLARLGEESPGSG